MNVALYGITVYEEDRLNNLMAELDEPIKDEICRVFKGWHDRQMSFKELNVKNQFKEEIIRAILDV